MKNLLILLTVLAIAGAAEAQVAPPSLTIVSTGKFKITEQRSYHTDVMLSFEMSFIAGPAGFRPHFDLLDEDGFSVAAGYCALTYRGARLMLRYDWEQARNDEVVESGKYRKKVFCFLGEKGDVSHRAAKTLILTAGVNKHEVTR